MAIQRYHAIAGSGTGIGCSLGDAFKHTRLADASGDVMWADGTGFWVLHADHKQELAETYALGYEDGKAQAIHTAQQVKTSWHDYADQPFAGIAHAYIAPVESDESKRTKQLLNELYHDRARLEKVVADAVVLLKRTKSLAKVYQWKDEDEEYITESSIMGSVMQFIDTHGE